ncbi:MAG: hypothetical protein PHV68_09495 [Candidatus Gastranaerophilales bacterium]|nr:hypothetical protein [Candidatus Gastranaerophilales bacterium]
MSANLNSNSIPNQEKPLNDQIAKLKSIIASIGYSNPDEATNLAKSKQLGNFKKIEKANLEKIAKEDCKKIATMLKNGKIDQNKAKELLSKIESSLKSKIENLDKNFNAYSDEILEKVNSSVVNSFTKKYPDFNNIPNINELLDYIKSARGTVNPQDLEFMMNFISKLSPQASPDENLNDLNQKDISKLTSSVNAPAANLGIENKVFTREDIKKMSPDEFKKYEKIIFEQMANGLLK